MQTKFALQKLLLAMLTSTVLVACGSDNNSSSDDNNTEVPVAENIGAVEAQVFNALTGEQISGATATVVDQSATATSSVDGKLIITKLEVGQQIVRINKTGFAEQVVLVDIQKNQTTQGINIQLIPLQSAGTVNPTQGGTVTLTNSTAQVTIPANSLRRADGQAIQGNVDVSIALIDTAQDVRRMPGDLAIYQGTMRVPLESFGAMTVALTDSTGASVVLNSNATANIRIPVMSRGDAPTTVPLYYFDASLGYWVVDGSQVLTLVEDALGNFFYEGTSSTLNTVNADIPYETTNVVGCIENTSGTRLSNASIVLEGIDYSGYSTAYSNSQGNFTIPARINSKVIIGGQQGNLSSNTLEADTTANQLNLTECLVVSEANQNVKIRLSWGQLPYDVDSHIIAPSGDHIYFGGQGNLLTAPYLNLDVDDTDSYGPEIVTVNRLMVGTYNYFVHNYSRTNEPGLYGSPIRVELNTKSGTQVFAPTSASGESMFWHAFSLNVSENCQITINPMKKWLSDEEVEALFVTQSTPQYCQPS